MQGDVDQALTLAQDCVQLAEATDARKNLVKGWRLVGQVLLSQNQPKAAEAFLEKAISLALELNNLPQLWKTHRTLGDFYWNANSPNQLRQLVTKLCEL